MAECKGAVKLLELEATVLGSEGLKEKVSGADVGTSTAENLSFKFSFTLGGEAVARPWGAGTEAAAADGLMGAGLRENAEGADGVSEGGLEANLKPEDPEPKGMAPPMEKAEVEHVTGTEKVKLADADDTGAVGTMLNEAAEEEEAAAGGVEAAGKEKPRFGNAAGADMVEAAILGGWVTKEPSLGSLSPSEERRVGGETSCLTPGLRLSSENGQSNPSVDSISIVGAGGRVFSSLMKISCWLVKSMAKPSGRVSSFVLVTGSSARLASSRIQSSQILSSCLAMTLTSMEAAEAANTSSQSSMWLRK